jgi:hypothetical protein
MQQFVNIATDTLFATGANICGFMFTYKGTDANGIPFGDIKSQKSTNGVPNLILNSETGYLHGINVDITGTINATSGTFKNVTIESGSIGPFSIVSGILSSKAIYDNSANSYAGFRLSAGQIEFYNEKTEASLKFGGTTKYVTWEGVTYEAGIDIQSPNVLLGMHVNTPSLPLVVEGGNIILHPNISSYVSIRGITLNARAVSVNTKLNSNDDIISFTNTSDITVTMPDANAGKVLFIKKYNTAKVTLTGGIFMNANDGGTDTTFTPAQHSHMFVKDIRGRWIDFYCG